MIRKPPLMVWAALVSVVVLLLLSTWNTAQDAETAVLTVDEPLVSDRDAVDASDARAGEAAKPPALREQTIYIPYEDLRKTFETKGRGVFLPYEKFRALWDAARHRTTPVDSEKPPVGAVLVETVNEASVEEETIQVAAKVRIDLLAEGWHEVDLRLPGAAITEAKIEGEPARVIKDPAGGGYKLLVEKTGEESEQITLDLRYAKAIERSPGHNSVSFDAPQAPISRWTVRIPESGVKVDFFPLIAATEQEQPTTPAVADGHDASSPDEDPADEEAIPENEEETVVLAFVGAAPTIRIGWTPKAEGATGLEALATVQSQQQITIDEGVVRTLNRLDYTISRAELGQLAIEVPADERVVNVFDANIRKWTVARGADTQTIDVQLFDPAKTSQTVLVELEKFSDRPGDIAPASEPGAEPPTETVMKKPAGPVVVAAPVVRALGVGRQQGVVVVQVAPGLSAEASRSAGLLQIDRSELADDLTGRAWDFAYRYAAVPYQLDLTVEKIQPRITVDTLCEAKLRPERLRLDASSIYTIERAGVFQLEWDIPSGYDVRRVLGRRIMDVAEVDVDSYHVGEVDDESMQKRLTINLAHKALGRVGLVVSLERNLDEPDLRAPTGRQVAVSIPVPRVAADTVERATGRVVVYAPESLRLNPLEGDGLRTVSFEEAKRDTVPFEPSSELREVLAFVHGDQARRLDMHVERRKPQVTVGQLLAARIEDGVVKCKDTFYYEIEYSDVKSLRIDIPVDLAATLRNDTEGIRDAAMEPQPEDVAEGYVAWRFSGESELFGREQIDLSWETKLDGLGVGGTVEIDLPRLVPMEVDRAYGQIVLSKAETIDLHESGESQALRAIDPQRELLEGVRIADGAAAFEFHGPWKLTVAATRYDLAEIKHTSIERAVLRAVVHRGSGDRGGAISVQALYRIRSARQRIQLALPAGCTVTRSQLGGAPVALETGQDARGGLLYYVPLRGSTPDRPVLLELQYTQPHYAASRGGEARSAAGIRLEYPTFPLEPAMQECYVCVYLPEEWDLVAAAGPWTQQFEWYYDGREHRSLPANNPNDSALQDWVTESDQGGGRGLLATFPTDGVCYVFSALQPGAPETDALRLATLQQSVLDALVLGLIVLAGVLMLPMRLMYRVLFMAALAIAWVLIHLFHPILAHQIGDRTLLMAVGIVLILWVAKFLAWTLPRRTRALARNLQWPARSPSVAAPARPCAAEGGNAPAAVPDSEPADPVPGADESSAPALPPIEADLVGPQEAERGDALRPAEDAYEDESRGDAPDPEPSEDDQRSDDMGGASHDA